MTETPTTVIRAGSVGPAGERKFAVGDYCVITCGTYVIDEYGTYDEKTDDDEMTQFHHFEVGGIVRITDLEPEWSDVGGFHYQAESLSIDTLVPYLRSEGENVSQYVYEMHLAPAVYEFRSPDEIEAFLEEPQ